ncbi:MAG: HAMP domain-containing protein [Burkholderiales bacterium]|nr:HAMP domain-containing protein [Burkholderiales bacterium]
MVAASAALGGSALYLWRQASEESLRINAMIEQVQEMRGNLYRQVKEVFDAVFLDDDAAIVQYREYEQRIDAGFATLQKIAREPEQDAVAGLADAYREVKAEADGLLASDAELPSAARRKLFDTDLELGAFGAYELAFERIERLVNAQKAQSRSRLTILNRLAPLLLALPILLAIGLFIYSRLFLQRAIVRPLLAAQSATTMISRCDLAQHVPERGAAELVMLAQSVNHMAADLADSRAALLRAEKQSTLAALVPVVAHNIRNPLASIRATAQVLGDPALSAELRDGLHDIIATADRLDRWTHALLSYLNSLQPQRTACKLPELLDDVLQLLRARLIEKNISVERQGWSNAPGALLDTQLMDRLCMAC